MGRHDFPLPTGRTVIGTRTKTFLPLALLAAIAVVLGAAANASALKVAAAGDISCPADSTAQNAIEPGQKEPHPAAMKCQGRRVAQMIAAENPRIAIAAGDLIQGQTSYRHAYNDFDLAWGSIEDRIVATMGNHDYHENAEGRQVGSGYFRFWESKGVPAWRYGKPGKGWSSWNFGKWHMINLNSNCRITDCTFTGPQLQWLIEDLKKDRSNPETQCTLAYFHHPLFSTGVDKGRTGDRSGVVNLWELLYRFRADVVITGHQHFYERYLPQDPSGRRDPTGVTQIISGTGGASTFPPDEGGVAANSAATERRLGATFLELEDNGFSSYFKGIDEKVYDVQPQRNCLKKGAGHDRRLPRVNRYERHMKRMRQFDRRIAARTARIRKLERNDGEPALIQRLEIQRESLEARREKLRPQRLY